MNKQITIIGSNSILYNKIKDQLTNYNIIELSHKDLCSVKEIVNPVVFILYPAGLILNLLP